MSVNALPTIWSLTWFLYGSIIRSSAKEFLSYAYKITVLDVMNSSVLNFDLAACVTSSRRGVPFQQFM